MLWSRMPVIIKRLFFIPPKAKDQGCFRIAPWDLSLAGFTLVEIIVATIILSLVILGMLSIFLAGNKHVIHTRERMTSAELGKLFVDPLQMDVNWSTWNSGAAGNALALGTTYCDGIVGHTQNKNCPPAAQRRVNDRPFTATYVTSLVADNTGDANDNLRRVTTRVSWTEPSS